MRLVLTFSCLPGFSQPDRQAACANTRNLHAFPPDITIADYAGYLKHVRLEQHDYLPRNASINGVTVGARSRFQAILSIWSTKTSPSIRRIATQKPVCSCAA